MSSGNLVFGVLALSSVALSSVGDAIKSLHGNSGRSHSTLPAAARLKQTKRRRRRPNAATQQQPQQSTSGAEDHMVPNSFAVEACLEPGSEGSNMEYELDEGEEDDEGLMEDVVEGEEEEAAYEAAEEPQVQVLETGSVDEDNEIHVSVVTCEVPAKPVEALVAAPADATTDATHCPVVGGKEEVVAAASTAAEQQQQEAAAPSATESRMEVNAHSEQAAAQVEELQPVEALRASSSLLTTPEAAIITSASSPAQGPAEPGHQLEASSLSEPEYDLQPSTAHATDSCGPTPRDQPITDAHAGVALRSQSRNSSSGSASSSQNHSHDLLPPRPLSASNSQASLHLMDQRSASFSGYRSVRLTRSPVAAASSVAPLPGVNMQPIKSAMRHRVKREPPLWERVHEAGGSLELLATLTGAVSDSEGLYRDYSDVLGYLVCSGDAADAVMRKWLIEGAELEGAVEEVMQEISVLNRFRVHFSAGLLTTTRRSEEELMAMQGSDASGVTTYGCNDYAWAQNVWSFFSS